MFIKCVEPKDANKVQKNGKQDGKTDCNFLRNESGCEVENDPRKADTHSRSKKRFEENCEVIDVNLCNTPKPVKCHHSCNQVAEQGTGPCAKHVDAWNADQDIVGNQFHYKPCGNQLNRDIHPADCLKHTVNRGLRRGKSRGKSKDDKDSSDNSRALVSARVDQRCNGHCKNRKPDSTWNSNQRDCAEYGFHAAAQPFRVSARPRFRHIGQCTHAESLCKGRHQQKKVRCIDKASVKECSQIGRVQEFLWDNSFVHID